MYRTIISVFLIFFFIGCESRNSFDKVVEKLKKQQLPKKELKQKKVLKQKEEPKLVNIEKPTQKKVIKNLALKDVNENNITIHFIEDGIRFDQFKNKIVILDIFTTWCPPCIESIPHLNQIQKKYKKDVKVVGILLEEKIKNSSLKHFIKKQHIRYTVTNCKENFTLIDTWGGVSGYPTIIIFDKNGKYFNHYNGSPPYEMLESDIKKALKIRKK